MASETIYRRRSAGAAATATERMLWLYYAFSQAQLADDAAGRRCSPSTLAAFLLSS